MRCCKLSNFTGNLRVSFSRLAAKAVVLVECQEEKDEREEEFNGIYQGGKKGPPLCFATNYIITGRCPRDLTFGLERDEHPVKWQACVAALSRF